MKSLTVAGGRRWSGWPALLGLSIITAAHAARADAPAAPPPHARVAAAAPVNRYTATDGEELFTSLCQACHMADAKGARGAGMFPALAANPKLTSATYPAYIVLNGLHGMPSFANDLDDVQVAAVVNYVVTHFGNHAKAPITVPAVKAMRPAT